MNKKSVLIASSMIFASSMILNIALMILVSISVKRHVMPWVAFLLIVGNIVLILCMAESCILRMKDDKNHQGKDGLSGKSNKTVISAPQLRAKIMEMAELRIRMDNKSKPEKSEISQIKDDDEEGGPESSP